MSDRGQKAKEVNWKNYLGNRSPFLLHICLMCEKQWD